MVIETAAVNHAAQSEPIAEDGGLARDENYRVGALLSEFVGTERAVLEFPARWQSLRNGGQTLRNRRLVDIIGGEGCNLFIRHHYRWGAEEVRKLDP